jgi:hypothetical protein
MNSPGRVLMRRRIRNSNSFPIAPHRLLIAARKDWGKRSKTCQGKILPWIQLGGGSIGSTCKVLPSILFKKKILRRNLDKSGSNHLFICWRRTKKEKT